MYEFDELREILLHAPAVTPELRRIRLYLFDIWRYQEEYEKIFEMLDNLKIIYYKA